MHTVSGAWPTETISALISYTGVVTCHNICNENGLLSARVNISSGGSGTLSGLVLLISPPDPAATQVFSPVVANWTTVQDKVGWTYTGNHMMSQS